jgi:hypothetical protein
VYSRPQNRDKIRREATRITASLLSSSIEIYLMPCPEPVKPRLEGRKWRLVYPIPLITPRGSSHPRTLRHLGRSGVYFLHTHRLMR